MPYNILTPAPLDTEVTEKTNKTYNKTIKNKSAKFSDIIKNNNNNDVKKSNSNQNNFIETYTNTYLNNDDDDNEMSDFYKIDDTEKLSNINNKFKNNNTYENDIQYENINNNNLSNYDNNYTLNNDELNKHLTINKISHDYIDNNSISNKELLTKINYIIHLFIFFEFSTKFNEKLSLFIGSEYKKVEKPKDNAELLQLLLTQYIFCNESNLINDNSNLILS
jgi:hypothetical protein